MRIAYVLANLTTYFEEARDQISNSINKIIQVSLFYFDQESEETKPNESK